MKNTQMKPTDLFVDYPMHMLGCLKPPQNPDTTQVHGVVLSHQVVEELRKLGIPIGWYHSGELMDAVIACHYDSQLVDDKHGVSFRDKLHLTDEEKSADEMTDFAHARMRIKSKKPAFIKHILQCHEECDERDKAACHTDQINTPNSCISL